MTIHALPIETFEHLALLFRKYSTILTFRAFQRETSCSSTLLKPVKTLVGFSALSKLLWKTTFNKMPTAHW